MSGKKHHVQTLNNQQGSALLMALFIMVVLMLLGTALVRILSTSSEGIAQEVLGTRALMAANSAAEAELAKLFPLNPSTLIPPSTYCQSTTNTSYDFTSVDGLNNCSANTVCTKYASHDAGNGVVNYYRITSTGQCGTGAITNNTEDNTSGVVLSTRQVQIEARSL